MSHIDVRRVVYLRSADNLGSGYLVARDLVLTAAHVVGPVDSPVEVQALHPQQGSGGLSLTLKVEFQVEAVSGGHLERSANSDGFALLSSRQSDPFELGHIAPVRWAKLVGDRPLPAETFGFPQLADTLANTEVWLNVEHALGKLTPGTGAREVPSTDGPAWSLAFQVESGTPAARVGGGALWQGASGAALFGDDQLIGVLSEYQPTVEGRLRATPVCLLGNEASLVECLKKHIGSDVVFEPIWAGREILQPPYTALPDIWSAADLLTARHNVVPFSGRVQELRRLTDWCLGDGPASVPVLLMTGNSAVGKTRLALELCHQMIRRGWVAGRCRPTPRMYRP